MSVGAVCLLRAPQTLPPGTKTRGHSLAISVKRIGCGQRGWWKETVGGGGHKRGSQAGDPFPDNLPPRRQLQLVVKKLHPIAQTVPPAQCVLPFIG